MSGIAPRSKYRWAWLFHNGVIHPLAGFCAFVGWRDLADTLHDATIPPDSPPLRPHGG